MGMETPLNIATIKQDEVVESTTTSDWAKPEYAGKIVERDHPSGGPFNIRSDADDDHPIGTVIQLTRTEQTGYTPIKRGGIIATNGLVRFRGPQGNVQYKLDGHDGYGAYMRKTAANVWLIAGTVSSDLTLTELTASADSLLEYGDSFLTYNNGTYIFTVRLDSAYNHPEGTLIQLGRLGAGALTIAAEVGVTIGGGLGNAPFILDDTIANNAYAYLTKTATANVWNMQGNVTGS